MREYLSSFPGLLIEVVIVLAIFYWLGSLQAVILVVTVFVVAILFRIMQLLEMIASRSKEANAP